MARLVDISGQRFGVLTALHPHGRDAYGRALWQCRCDCGQVLAIRSNNLRTGNSKSCGCQKYGSNGRCINLIGRVFGRLLVTERDATKKGKTYWICRCDCGAVRSVWSAHLLRGRTRSCGCLASEKSREVAYKHLTGRRGSDHPRWNRELSSEERNAGRTLEDKEWAASIIARSNYQCELCGATGRLNAHHIKAYASRADLRTKLSNGIALCIPCHTGFHRTCGYNGFSEDDFYGHFQLPNPGCVAGLSLPVGGDLANVVKYVARAARKGSYTEDLRKARWYLDREIQRDQEQQASGRRHPQEAPS